jgi:hypothetical protein
MLGYHPYAEDGGIYSTGVAMRLQPELFPAERALPHSFALAHTSQSLFVPALTAVIRLLHLPQDIAMLLLFFLSLVATLAAAAALAGVLFPALRPQRWAVTMLAAAMGLPIAGTSLYLADPYLTSRSVWTPLLLWGLTLLLQRRFAAAAICMMIALPFHPLMAALSILLFAAVLARRSSRPVAYSAALAALSFGAMAALQSFAPTDSPAVRAASLSRGYWFLVRWEWYELIGLVAAPLLLLGFAMFRPVYARCHAAARDLAFALCTVAAITASSSLLLIHTTNASFLLARLQPLRLLHPIYLVFLLIAGGLAADLPVAPLSSPFAKRLHRSGTSMGHCIPAILCMVACAGLLFMQRGIYDDSGHWELPGLAVQNQYEQAFLWMRANTPLDAVIAADANYTTATGEDAHMLRAIALRTTLPDAAKDGGVASVVPSLADDWKRASDLQEGLSQATDAERVARVQPLGATWLLLPAASQTQFACPYRNAAAKVCRLP